MVMEFKIFRRLNGDGYMKSFSNTNLYPTLTDAIRYADDTDRDGDSLTFRCG
jgi:hypothetical protein